MAGQHPEDGARQTSPTLSELIRIGSSLDVTVHSQQLEPDVLGIYVPEEARVYLAPGLTLSEMRSTLAHELGHVYFAHDCEEDRFEREAWTFAADLLVDAAEYARLEREGHDAHEIAEHLGVTDAVLAAFREHHLQQLGAITYGKRFRGRFTNALARSLS